MARPYPANRSHRGPEHNAPGPGGHIGRPYEETEGGFVGADCISAPTQPTQPPGPGTQRPRVRAETEPGQRRRRKKKRPEGRFFGNTY